MINRDLYFRDPTTLELLNNGVSKVAEIGNDDRQEKTLRFELETFVCDGEYARGLERILKSYLDGLGRSEQKAVWVSGFFGSGKSHLVKVLRYLWEDYRFPDGATARSLVRLPSEVSDLLTELTNRSKQLGGLRAAAGTLGAGAMDSVSPAAAADAVRVADTLGNGAGRRRGADARDPDLRTPRERGVVGDVQLRAVMANASAAGQIRATRTFLAAIGGGGVIGSSSGNDKKKPNPQIISNQTSVASGNGHHRRISVDLELAMLFCVIYV